MTKKFLLALLFTLPLALACGPEATDEANVTPVVTAYAEGQPPMCYSAWYCFKGASPVYYRCPIGNATACAAAKVSCTAAVAAGTCKGSNGACVWALREPLGCAVK